MIDHKKLAVICSSIFLLVVFFFFGWQLAHKPRIFILHSYHPNMPWVQNLNRGIKRNFDGKPYINLRYFYMDTKRKRSRQYLNRISHAALDSIYNLNPDIIIAFDHAAHTLVRERFQNTHHTKIILAGVTDPDYLESKKDNPDIIGITEQVPVGAVREILSLVFRYKRKIYYLSDNSDTARALSRNLSHQNWGSFDLIAKKNVDTFSQWKMAVHEANQKADILLLSTYHNVTLNQRLIPVNTLIEWTQKESHIPVVGVYESFMLDGGLMAIAISSMEQGFTASWLAMEIIEHQLEISHIPMLRGKTFALFMDKNALTKRFPEAKIPKILDAFTNSDSKIDERTIRELHLKPNPPNA